MTTVGLSLDTFCRGLLAELRDSCGHEVIALSSPDGHLTSLGEREGVRTIGVAMRRDISPWADLRSLCRLVRVLRRERPDMLHTMTPKAGLLGMIAARIAGVPLRVHTFTGLLFPTSRGLRRLLLATTDRITCACASHIIAEGQGVRSDLLAHHITRRPVTVLGHGNVRGVDLTHYSPSPRLESEAAALRRRLGIAPDDKVMIYVGRFVTDKGLRELLDALPAIRSSVGRRVHLIMAGDTDGGRDNLTSEQLASQPDVHLSGGWVDDVRPWLLAADILVFPSYREGFPNVVLEAGAMGLPAVVTDINGSREIITDGVNGLIVPPAMVAPLAEAVARLLTLPPPALDEMARAARLNIQHHYSRPYIWQCLKEYYSSLRE